MSSCIAYGSVEVNAVCRVKAETLRTLVLPRLRMSAMPLRIERFRVKG